MRALVLLLLAGCAAPPPVIHGAGDDITYLDIKAWESRNGRLTNRTELVVRNAGISVEAANYLVTYRDVRRIGTDRPLAPEVEKQHQTLLATTTPAKASRGYRETLPRTSRVPGGHSVPARAGNRAIPTDRRAPRELHPKAGR